jgi:hypothetical protein
MADASGGGGGGGGGGKNLIGFFLLDARCSCLSSMDGISLINDGI